ncbi:MAG: MFS transporter [Holophagaceae bacterium]|nr:MFS transporter [Holophagaceae bacterium]
MNPWRGLGGLPRMVWVLSVATFINRAGTMALPFLALYLMKQMGLGASQAGQGFIVFGFGAMVAAPLGGWLADRHGPLMVMRTSLLLSGLLMLALPLVRDVPSFFLLIGLWALVSEGFRPASMSILADLAPPELRKAVFSLNRLAINLGMSVGPALGGFIATRSYRGLFWVDGATTLAAWAVLALLVRNHPHQREKSSSPAPLSALRDPAMAYFLLAIIPVVVVFFQHEGPMPIFLVRDLALPESFYGSLFTINTLLIVLLEVRLNLATSHWPHRRTLMLGSLLYAIGFGAMVAAQAPAAVIATVVVWTFGEMILFPGMSDYVASIAPADRRGAYMGLYTFTFSMAFSLGPWIGTWMLDAWGGRVLWPVMGILGLVSALALSRIKPEAISPPGPGGPPACT